MDAGMVTIAGMGCCCFATFVVLLVAASLAFRPRRPKPGDVAGVAPAPDRGVQTRASLTRMEYHHDEEGPPPRSPNKG